MNPINVKQISILDETTVNVLTRLDLSALAGQRIFVTGGTGFFGLWLLTALRLLQKHASIEVCVLSRNPARFLSVYPQFREQSWLTFVTGNIRDFQIPNCYFDLLLHAATETALSAHAKPQQMLDDIIMGTSQVLKLAQLCGVRRMLLVSSGAVYGVQPSHLMHQPDDSQLACDPLMSSSAYGEGKRVMELMGALIQNSAGIESIVARCYSFCGPGLPLDGHFAMGNFVRDALFKDEIIVHGNGSPVRSYLYGADLAVWLLYLLINGEAGKSYNVGSEEGVSIRDLAITIRDLLAPNKFVRVEQNYDIQMAVRQRYVPDTTRAKVLGCKQWTSLTDSLDFTAKYINGACI